MADKKPLIATAPIYVGGYLAHNIGDEVPVENVERNDWQELVAEPGTKAAAAAGDGE